VQEQRQHVHRGRIGPVHVVEQQRQRPLGRQPLEQRAHRPRQLVTLTRHGRRLHVRPHSRQHRRQLTQLLALELAQRRLARPGQQRVQRVRPQREGQIPLELGRPASQHQQTTVTRPPGQLGEQPRLADPGLAA
jgi:hypothetical protein